MVEFPEIIVEQTQEMETKKTLHLLVLLCSLLMIEKLMASRILAEYNPPPDNDNSRTRVNGSPPKRDNSWNGDGSHQGMLLVPPPAMKTTISQAGPPNMSASAIVVAPTDAKVNVSTAVSPTSATARASATSSSNTSSTSVTSGGTVSKSRFTTVSQSSSATLIKHP